MEFSLVRIICTLLAVALLAVIVLRRRRNVE